MSENTVRKYVGQLEEKSFITTESTSIFTKEGMKRNGNLLYTILPIQGAIDAYYRRQLEMVDEEQQKHRTLALIEKLNLSPAEAPA